MKKSSSVVIGLVILVILVVGGYLIFHKSPAKTTNSSTNTNTSSNAPAVNNAVLETKTDATVGQFLADSSGKPLYTYNADTTGVSNCTGTCLANWPAYVDKGSTSNLPAGVSTITRKDNGQVQYTYNGKPLYYFVGDSSSQVTGNGVDNFSIAKPATSSSSTGTSSSSSNSSSSTSSPSSSSNSSSSNYPY